LFFLISFRFLIHPANQRTMATSYEEVDLIDMELEEEGTVFRYPCPCGDKFFITIDELLENEDKAKCPSCSLILKVKYDANELEKRYTSNDETENGECKAKE